MATPNRFEDPYPMHEIGPFWQVQRLDADGDVTDMHHRDTYAEAQQDELQIRNEGFRCCIQQVAERWRARCCLCGEPSDQEDYVYETRALAVESLETPDLDGTANFTWLSPERPVCIPCFNLAN